MPPKTKVRKEDILKAALALIRERGAERLTAKVLAEALSCSTQPVFWHFESMEDLKKQVYAEALKIFGAALRRGEEGVSPYMAIGLNYIRFAAEEKGLFRMLFMSDVAHTDVVGAHVEMDYIVGVIEESEHIGGEDAQTVYRDMWLFSHGIAAMTATGTASFSEEEVKKMLKDVCRGLIGNLRSKNKNQKGVDDEKV